MGFTRERWESSSLLCWLIPEGFQGDCTTFAVGWDINVQFMMIIFPISPNSTMLIRCDRLFCCSLADLMAFLNMLLSLLTSFRLVPRFSCKFPCGPHFGGVAFSKGSFFLHVQVRSFTKNNVAVLATSWSNHWFIWGNLSLSRLQGKYL